MSVSAKGPGTNLPWVLSNSFIPIPSLVYLLLPSSIFRLSQLIRQTVKTRVSCITLLFKTLRWLHISLRGNIFITVYKFPWDLVTWHLSDFTAYLLTLLPPCFLSVISFTPVSEPLNLLLSPPGALPTDILNACSLTFLRSLFKCHLIGVTFSGHLYKMVTAPPHFISILIIANEYLIQFPFLYCASPPSRMLTPRGRYLCLFCFTSVCSSSEMVPGNGGCANNCWRKLN